MTSIVAPCMRVGHFEISDDDEPFIIAEIGHNHQGNIDTCKKMIDAAKHSGASAVKLQKRDNKTLFTEVAYNKPYENENSFGRTYGEHREFLEFNEEQYKELKIYAENLGLVFFATPFDIPSVFFLEKIGIPCYKIASAMITDTFLIETVAKTGKPVFLSTGACEMEDVDRAYEILDRYAVPVCLLHCIAAYPMMDYTEANMKVISELKTRYPNAVIGFSSHESGIVLPVVAYMLGARVIEKHFTLNRAMKGTDQKFSLEPAGMEKMVRDLNRVRQALGHGQKEIQSCELDAKKKLGKSIYARIPIKKGTVLTPDMIAFKCPAVGLHPYEVDKLLGRYVNKDLKKDELITMNCVHDERV